MATAKIVQPPPPSVPDVVLTMPLSQASDLMALLDKGIDSDLWDMFGGDLYRALSEAGVSTSDLTLPEIAMLE